jgi:DNA-binding transcriptional LysR family regulator
MRRGFDGLALPVQEKLKQDHPRPIGMIAVLAGRAARVFAAEAPLQILPLPTASPSLTIAMLWHRRVEDDAAHRWLPGLVRRVTRNL